MRYGGAFAGNGGDRDHDEEREAESEAKAELYDEPNGNREAGPGLYADTFVGGLYRCAAVFV